MHSIKKGIEGKRKQISSKGRQDQAAIVGIMAGINLNVYFPFYILNAWCCIWLFVVMAWFLPSVTNVFILALPFLNSHGVMGLSCFG